jgi:AbrB family looped-hinge helix DNA binding protein
MNIRIYEFLVMEMSVVVKVSKHGTITLPKDFREKYGIKASGYVKVEDAGDSIRIVGAEVVEVPPLVRRAQEAATRKAISVEDIVKAVRKARSG